MGLEALELVERREIRILVVQVHDQADRHQIFAVVIHEGAALGAGLRQRPTLRVHHQALLEVRRVDLPQLLDADAELLRINATAQLVLVHQHLGQRAASTFGEQRVLGVQLHALRVGILVLAVLADPHVAGSDSAHCAVLGVEHLGRGEARIDLHSQRLGLLAEPAADVAQADDVVAVIVHQPRQGEVREAQRTALGQPQEAVVGDVGLDRSALFLPVGDQLVQPDRVDHRARQDVSADFRALLDQADRDLVAALGRELLQSDRRRQPGRAAANDHHVIFHRLACHSSLALQHLFPMD